MNADKVNKGLTLITNVGVIVGIAFLALELRQNSDLMKAQSRTTMSQDIVDLLTLDIGNADFVDTIARGIRGDELSATEEAQFRRTYRAFIQYWNNLAYQYRIGLYDDSEFRLQIGTIRKDMELYPGLKAHWCEYKVRDASEELKRAIEDGMHGQFCSN